MKVFRMKQKFIDMLPKNKNICLLGLQGSRSMGLEQSEDADYDYRGVYVAYNAELLSLEKPKETMVFGDSKDDNADFVLHEIEKFFKLAIKGNPSVINLFFVPKYNIKTDVGDEIIKNRNLFLSEPAIRAAYGGYAMSQIMYLKRNRGDSKRKSKHVRHCFRLFDQGKELLKTGKISFPIKNPQYYLDLGEKIKEPGGLDELIKLFEKKDKEFNECESVLQPMPNYYLINKLLLKIRGIQTKYKNHEKSNLNRKNTN